MHKTNTPANGHIIP